MILFIFHPRKLRPRSRWMAEPGSTPDAGAPPARCWVARIGSVLVLEGPCPLPLPASNSDCVPEGMCVPALGPVPAPEVTPAGSRLVPIFPLHVAPWLDSCCPGEATRAPH